MKMNLLTMKQQAQDFVLRLFVESLKDSSSTPSDAHYYLGSRCGTYTRLHQ